MENIKHMNYCVNEVLFEKSAEQSIDMEINLPEYCGDISSVLACFAFPNITSSSLTPDSIQVEGTILIRMLYLSDGEIYSYEQSSAFSKRMDNDADTVGTILDVRTFVQYVNCRPTNQRRAEVNGSFVIAVKGSTCREKNVIEAITGEDIQVNKDIITACSASGNASYPFHVSQVVDIGSNKPSIKSIIRNTALPIIEQTKQVSGKVLVKGELKIRTLYKSEENTPELIENSLPISQILDIQGMDENSTVDMKPNLTALDVAVKPSALGNMSLLDISAVVVLNACAYNCIDFPVIKDAYSTDYECECSYKDVKVDKILTQIETDYMNTVEFQTNERVRKVIDVWCDDLQCSAQSENGNIAFSGTYKVFVLYENDANTPALLEKEATFVFNENSSVSGIINSEPTAQITGCDFVLKDNSLQIRANIRISAVVFECINQKVIESVNIGEKLLVPEHQLCVYYCKKGESLWEIARYFNTTVSSIRAENDLEQDTLSEDLPLLIWC